MKEIPNLITPRLLLRPFVENDLENIFNGLSHPDVIQYYGVSYHTPEAAQEQMKFYRDLQESGTGIWWAICSPDNSRFHGAGGLNSIIDKKAEIGFWLLPEFWRQGIMNEALPFIWQYGFDELGLNRIEGFVETENHRCKKAIEKLGFRHESTLEDCEIKNEKLISLDVYVKLNTD